MSRASTFKLSKQTKTIMSRILDKTKRDHFKNIMIDAQIAGETKVKHE